MYVLGFPNNNLIPVEKSLFGTVVGSDKNFRFMVSIVNLANKVRGWNVPFDLVFFLILCNIQGDSEAKFACQLFQKGVEGKPGVQFLKNATKMLFSKSAINISCYEELSML